MVVEFVARLGFLFLQRECDTSKFTSEGTESVSIAYNHDSCRIWSSPIRFPPVIETDAMVILWINRQ